MEVWSSLLFLLAGLIGAPTFGWVALLPWLVGIAVFFVVQGQLVRFRRPELALLFCFALVEFAIGVGISVATGPRIYLLPVLMMPVLLASAVFPVRVVVLVVAYSALIMLTVAFGFDSGAVRSTPFVVAFPFEVMVAGAGIAMVVARLDLATRRMAVLDPLTGIPNRLALLGRVAELEHQSRVNGRPVALVIGDPDHFKAINDRLGHDTGDVVLRELASRMQAELGPAGELYRLGGEEFIVLIGDADADAGAAVAERLRRDASSRPIEGLTVQVTFGVAASTSGEVFSFASLFGLADSALYAAKAAGGNRIGVWHEDRPAISQAVPDLLRGTADPVDARAPGRRVEGRLPGSSAVERTEVGRDRTQPRQTGVRSAASERFRRQIAGDSGKRGSMPRPEAG